MKKLAALLMAVLMVLSLASCTGDKPVVGGESMILYENTGEDKMATIEYDMDNDGKDEKIALSSENGTNIIVTDGYNEISLGYSAYYIEKVYGIDLDVGDGYKELAIITTEESSDTMLRVLRLKNTGFETVSFEFKNTYTGEVIISDYVIVGYEPKINVELNTLKTSVRGRYGMWCVEAEFIYDGEMFTEAEMKERNVVRSSYEKVGEFMENEPETYITMGIIEDETEIELLKAGYVKAHADFSYSEEVSERKGMTEIKKGEVFRITKEDSDGFVYIEKQSGKSGWINLGEFKDNRMEVSELAFFMAD